jgi:hypothetical protein
VIPSSAAIASAQPSSISAARRVSQNERITVDGIRQQIEQRLQHA